MEKVRWGSKIAEIIFTVLVTTLVSIGVTYLFEKDKCSINIGTSIYQDNKYITSVIISNDSKNKAIKNLEISISGHNEILDGMINASFNIDKNDNLMTINYIPPEDTVSLILVTKNAIDLKSMKVAYDGQINTTYLGKKSATYFFIITQVILYTIMLIALRYLEYKDVVKKDNKIINIENKMNELQKKADEDCELLLGKLNAAEQKSNSVNIEIHKMRIYYLARMKDYSKELDFWKNTIKKFMYQNSGNEKNNDEIFNIVTNELKTFGTKSKLESYYDELFYLARNINDVKKE